MTRTWTAESNASSSTCQVPTGRMLRAVGCHVASLPYLPQVVGCDAVVCSILLGTSVPSNKKADTCRVDTRSCFLQELCSTDLGKCQDYPWKLSWKSDHHWMGKETKVLKHRQQHFYSLRTTDPQRPQTHLPTMPSLCLCSPWESDFKRSGEKAETLPQTDYYKREFHSKASLVP